MSHSYRDTQGGHIDPPQVVNCPNHPRLDRVKTCIVIKRTCISIIRKIKYRSGKTVHTNLFAQYRKLHKFETTNSNFEKKNYFRHAWS